MLTGGSARGAPMFKDFRKNRWVGILLVVMGIGLSVAGVWTARERWMFLGSGARAPGTIVELRRERGARGMPQDHPIVRYTVPGTGRDVVFRSKFGMWPSPFSAGERVSVAYDPKDPDRAEIDSFWTLWLPSVGMGLLGMLGIGAGTITLRRFLASRKPGRK